MRLSDAHQHFAGGPTVFDVELRQSLRDHRDLKTITRHERGAVHNFRHPPELVKFVEHQKQFVRLIGPRKLFEQNVVDLLNQQTNDRFDRAEVANRRPD